MSMVLVIEDDHDTRVGLRAALENEGFSVFSATNGTQGFSMLQQIQGPVVVVLDQNMPLASGDDFLRLKEQHPRLRHVPVIVISAVHNRVAKFETAGFLRKPFDFARLIELIRQHSPTTFWTAEAG